jgi:hypothetical protein
MLEQQYFINISSNRIRLRWTENKKRFSKSISYGFHLRGQILKLQKDIPYEKSKDKKKELQNPN